MLPQDRKALLSKRIAKATARGSSELVYPKLVEGSGAQTRIHDAPPTIFHADASRAAGDLEMIRGSLTVLPCVIAHGVTANTLVRRMATCSSMAAQDRVHVAG